MSEVVRKYYDGCVEKEWARLSKPYRHLELTSTLHLVRDYFPSSGRVLDLGGGPGRYTIELAKRGYLVTLVDLSSECVGLAIQRLEELGLRAEAAQQGDARDLSDFESGTFDAALAMGPMYHLIEEGDRRRALLELRRVLRPGAPAIVGYLNPWGILRSGLSEFPELFRDETLIRSLLDDWVQAGEQPSFTEATFLTPLRALGELRAAGFEVLVQAGVEGFAAGMLDQVERMAQEDPAGYEVVLRLAAETCDHPAYRDCTEHLHVVVRSIAGRDRDEGRRSPG